MSESSNKAVAYALLSADELSRLRTSLKRVYPIPTDMPFDEILVKLEAALAKGNRPS